MGAAATGAAATGAAAQEAAATEVAATRAAATGAAVLGAAPPAKRLKSAAFASRASARSAVVSKRREGCLSGSFALELPEKIRGIEEMDEDLSFQFEDGELQREEEKEEEEEEEAEEQREEEEAEEQREEEEDVDKQREEDEKRTHRPVRPSLPSQQGFTCSSCLSRNHFTAYPFCVCCGYKIL
jgi:hypothetical protein